MYRLVAATVLACAGCASVSDSWCGSFNSSTSDNKNVSQGLVQLNFENRLFLIVMTAGGQPTQLTGGANTGAGKIKRIDGLELSWTCDTRDGVTGVITFGSQKFKLEDGGVILVDLRGGKFRVEQAIADMSHFEGGNIDERLKSEAITDERIARFLQVCNSPY
jgi:hypothetical protein